MKALVDNKSPALRIHIHIHRFGQVGLERVAAVATHHIIRTAACNRLNLTRFKINRANARIG